MIASFFSHGKLLLSGEYAVLDGALALALPTRLGQHMKISEGTKPGLSWNSLDADGNCWLEAYFTPEALSTPAPNDLFPKAPEQRLLRTLQEAIQLNPDFLTTCLGTSVVTQVEFPRLWGLGTSSTFIANLAQWAAINPYLLSERTLGGSGYDIACANHSSPIFYRKISGTDPEVKPASFNPPFKDQLWLVYLNAKQDSREGIAQYRAQDPVPESFLSSISELSTAFTKAESLGVFQELMEQHEHLIANLLGIQRVKDRLFPDYSGAVKSLGAWGGDFILAAGPKHTPQYFSEKGYATILRLAELTA